MQWPRVGIAAHAAEALLGPQIAGDGFVGALRPAPRSESSSVPGKEIGVCEKRGAHWDGLTVEFER